MISEVIQSTSVPIGPKGHFLFGNFSDFSKDPLGFMLRCAKEYGDIVDLGNVMALSGYGKYLINHPTYIEEVLTKKSRYFDRSKLLSRVFGRLLGDGLVTSSGDFWSRQRRLMQPAFHRERIAAYAKTMTDCINLVVDTWQAGEIRDIQQDMMSISLEVTTRTLFSADVIEQTSEISTALKEIMEYFDRRANNLILYLLPTTFPIPNNLRFQKIISKLNSVIYAIIRQRRISNKDTGDLLSMLLQAQDEDGSRMTDEQLRDEVMTLFLAGYETTALAMSWTLYLLAQHPEVTAKLAAELQTILAQRTPTAADLPQLHYANKVIKESLRIYPPFWGSARYALSDCKIGDHLIRSGTTVLLSPWVVHRDPRYFNDPESFHPERWTNEMEAQLPTYAYFPFSGGPRVCIGRSFALMETLLAIAIITQKFHLELAPGETVSLWCSVTLRPKNGIKMLVKKKPMTSHTSKPLTSGTKFAS